MEILIEDNSTISASGRVSIPVPANVPDGFMPRIRRLGAVFTDLQKDYGDFLAGDKKILGQEKAALRDRCDELVDAAIGALYQALVAINPETTNPEQEMSIPGEEQAFWVRRSGFLWHLRKQIEPSGAGDIRTHIKLVSEWPLRRLLERIRERAEDGSISPDEQRELLPDVLNLALQLIELRQHISSSDSNK